MGRTKNKSDKRLMNNSELSAFLSRILGTGLEQYGESYSLAVQEADMRLERIGLSPKTVQARVILAVGVLVALAVVKHIAERPADVEPTPDQAPQQEEVVGE